MRVGVDEAGKGPVLGPMVVAAVGVPGSSGAAERPADDSGAPGDAGAAADEGTVSGPDAAAATAADVLPDGVADSKRLTPELREELAVAIRADDRLRVGVAAVTVERIDDPATDMNSLTVAGHAEAIGALAAGLSDGEQPAVADCDVLADAGDTSEERFARRVRRALEDGPEIGGDPPTVEARHGADDADPVVAAASIVAKVERDARVAEIAAAYGDVGSGYPSDPATRSFLREYVREHDRLPDCARESWQTCDDVLAAAEQAALGEF